MFLEDMSVREQIHIFQNSNVIAAVHGAALTNIIYCKPNTVVVEIVHEGGSPQCFMEIAEAKKLVNYIRVPCPGFYSEIKENEIKKICDNPSNNVLPLKCCDQLLNVLSSC